MSTFFCAGIPTDRSPVQGVLPQCLMHSQFQKLILIRKRPEGPVSQMYKQSNYELVKGSLNVPRRVKCAHEKQEIL